LKGEAQQRTPKRKITKGPMRRNANNGKERELTMDNGLKSEPDSDEWIE